MKVKVLKSLGLLFIVLFVLSSASLVYALEVSGTIPVGAGPTMGAYDSGKGEIFVTNAQDNTVSVISDSTNTVTATIPVGDYPYGVAYDSAKGEVFVVNLHSNNVMVISDSTNAVVATIPVGQSPYNIAYDSAKGELFVTNLYDGTVSVISDTTNTVVATIPVGVEPFSVAYDSGKNEIFVGNFETDSRNYSLSVISDSTNTVVATVSLPGGPSFVVYDSAKGEIFVPTGVGTSATTVTVISDSTNAIVATVPSMNEVQVEGLAYDSSRGEIFVALHQSNKVAAISDSTNQVVETVKVGNLPWAATYDSGKNAIYVTNTGGNSVSVIAGPSTTTSATPDQNPGSFDFGSIIWIIIIIVIIIVLILIILLWFSRQRKFTVTVQNSQTQAPIQGATVSASGPQDLTGTTNNKGQIVFDDYKDGDYSIKASAAGYNPSTPMSISVKKKTECIIKLDPERKMGLTQPTSSPIPPTPTFQQAPLNPPQLQPRFHHRFRLSKRNQLTAKLERGENQRNHPNIPSKRSHQPRNSPNSSRTRLISNVRENHRKT